MAINKHAGQIYTPQYLVCDMLNIAHYEGAIILEKHIIDNSCGEGAFLCEIVKRYCDAYLQSNRGSELKKDLETYIHGIEIDTQAFEKCICKLNEVVKLYCLEDIHWDIVNENTLKVKKYNQKMDFVVGNPPYVRVHNLEKDYESVKNFTFGAKGMTDLYLVFFEIGFKMLNKNGRLCYITPSSWLNSIAGQNFRTYILHNKNLSSLVDLEHFQPFNATTYTLISLFEKDVIHNDFQYSRYNGETHSIENIERLNLEECFINKNMYLATSKNLQLLREIQWFGYNKYVEVKNGFATLADDIFINKNLPFTDYTIQTIKASTGNRNVAFFPYDKRGKPISKELIFSVKKIANYLNEHKKDLLKGQTEEENPQWYLFGRTQALKDVFVEKVSINIVIKDVSSIKLNYIAQGVGVYSGLYIIGDIDMNILREILLSEDFIQYLKTLKKYKSGGYYTFNSKDLEMYLNYKIAIKKINYNEKNESRISNGTIEFI